MSTRSTIRVPRWHVFGTLPFAAAVFCAVNGVYLLLVAFGNVTDYQTNFAFVQHVFSMDTTNFGQQQGTGLDPDVMWRAISDRVLWNVGYGGIIVWESLAAAVLIVSVVFFVRGFRGHGYGPARRWGTIGNVMIVLLFVGGFIAVGGEWFQMWRSEAWNGLDTAFRNAMIAGIALILLYLPSTHWPNETFENPRPGTSGDSEST